MATNDGIIYGIQQRSFDLQTGRKLGGNLLWYRHDGRDDGSFRWAAGEGKKVGQSWHGFPTVFSGGDGVIYAITDHGDLFWYRHDGREEGRFSWAAGEGQKVGAGWGDFASVFSGGDGVIYAITDDGDLLWYRHDGRHDGSFTWAASEGKKVGVGWDGFSTVFAGGEGVIYAIEESSLDPVTGQILGGDLLWYRHDGYVDGTFDWSAAAGKKVGNKWHKFPTVFAGGDGVIYAIADGGDLFWYRHDGHHDGTFRWAHSAGKKVDTGWDGFSTVFAGGDGPLAKASAEIAAFHGSTLAVLSVGTPTAPVRPAPGGGFVQPQTFGSIIKPRGEVPRLGDRQHVSIEIAAIRCFGTDDPDGDDQPYLITTVYALDPSRPAELVDTRRIDNGDGIGDVEADDVFAHNRPLATKVPVPGDGGIRVHVQLWDEELVGSTGNLKDLTSAAAQSGISAGLSAIKGGAAVAVALKASGILDDVGDAIGGWVAGIYSDLVGDNLVDQHDFVIPSSFLRALTHGDPAALNRTSRAIPGVSFNFPDRIEDDSWLFDRGQGTYRVFFRVMRA